MRMKKIVMSFMVLMLFVVICTPVQASEANGGSWITYNVDENSQYDHTLVVGENGSIKANNHSMRDGTFMYTLKVEEVKEFEIMADAGYQLEHIYYSENIEGELQTKVDIINQVKKNVLAVQGVATNMRLEFVFKKTTTPSKPEQPSTPENPNDSKKPIQDSEKVNTKDTSEKSFYLLLFLLALVAFGVANNEFKKRGFADKKED